MLELKLIQGNKGATDFQLYICDRYGVMPQLVVIVGRFPVDDSRYYFPSAYGWNF